MKIVIASWNEVLMKTGIASGNELWSADENWSCEWKWRKTVLNTATKHAQITKQSHPHQGGKGQDRQRDQQTNKKESKNSTWTPESTPAHGWHRKLTFGYWILGHAKDCECNIKKGLPHVTTKKQQNTSEQCQQQSHKPGKWITELGSKNRFSPLVNWGCCIANST